MAAIRHREGTWFVVVAWADPTLPQMNASWYRIGDRRCRPLVDGEPASDVGGGYWRVEGGESVRLERGDQTPPTFFETEPVPRPKGRGAKGFEWRHGSWRRFDRAAGGWVPV